MVLHIIAVDNFDFTRKIVKKKFGWKTRENFRFFEQKLDFYNSVNELLVSIFLENLFLKGMLEIPSWKKNWDKHT